ncbi:MAG: hypothetical protein OEN56_12640 [Gemmatimonadota bacterium]|nr:hypothetical protein [Gemmatimonadota bacterium]
MIRRRPLLSAVVAVLCFAAAAAIWFVSDAHGHGLATGDRRAIIGLSLAGALSIIAALWRPSGRPE